MTFSALGISIETRGADETARRLGAVSAAAKNVDTSVEKMVPSVEKAVSGINKLGREAKSTEGAVANLASRALTGFNAIAQRAAIEAEHIARQIERMTMHDLRAADIAAYGAELDRLRAKYNPLFAASKQYERSLDDLNHAVRVGAISAREHGEALNTLNSKYQMATTAANEFARAARHAAAEQSASVARSSQNAINAQLGVRTDFGGATRGADIAAYGAEIDTLRAKFNPLFALSKQYEQELNELNRAHKVGAISAREHGAALTDLNARYQVAANGAKGYTASAGMARAQTQNLMFQMQDISMMMMMGQNPFMLWAQQIGQVTMYGGKLTGVMAALKQMIGGLLSPLGLLATLFIFAGSAAISYFTNASGGAKTVDDILQEHKRNIEEIGPAYQKAAEAQRKYVEQSPSILEARLRDDARNAAQAILEASQQAVADIQAAMFREQTGASGMGFMASRFNGARVAIGEFVNSVSAGSPKIREFQEAIIRLSEAGVISESVAKELRDLTNEALRSFESLSAVKGLDQSALAFQNLQNAIDRVNPYDLTGRLARLEGSLTELSRGMQSGTITAQDLQRSIVALSSANPDMSAAIEEFGRLGLAALTAKANVDALNSAVQTTAKTGRLPSFGGQAEERDFFLRLDTSLADKLRQQHDQLEAAAKRSAKAGQSAANAYRDVVKGAQDRIEQMKLEMEMVGKTGGEAERYRMQLDLIQKATDKGRTLTADQLAQLKDLAAQYGEVAAAIEAARAVEQLEFDRGQMFRNDTDRAVYAQLRQIGLDLNSIDGQRVADAIRINKQMEDQRDAAEEIAAIFSDMFSGPIKDADEFFSRLTSGFAKIAQANIDKFFENMFTGRGGASGVSGNVATVKTGLLDQIGGWLDGILSNRKVIAAQNKAITTAASQIPAKPLVGAISSVGTAVTKTTSTIGTTLTSYLDALKKVESSNNYFATGPVTRSGDRAYGAYQVMGRNIPSWTEEALGRSLSVNEFLADRVAQDKTASYQFSKLYDRFGTWNDAISGWFSGQPLSKARTRSDGYNTTEQYVAKVNNALGDTGGIQNAVKIGAKAGVETGITNVATGSTSAGVQAPGMAQGGMGGLRGMLGNALSGFSLGLQSENGAMGGLGGAISGFMSGGPLGAVIGGIAGLLGGIFGKSRRKRQEREQARAELESQRGAIQSLLDAAMGTPSGEFESSWRQMSDEIAKARKLASKAGDSALVKELDLASKTFFDFLVDDWRRGLDGVMKAMESGHGMEGAFVRAQKAITDLADTLVGFVEDAKWFAETGGDYEKAKLTKPANDNGPPGSGPGWYEEIQREQGIMTDAYRVAVERYKGELEKLGIEAIIKTGTGRDAREIAAFASIEDLMKKMESLGVAFDDLGNILTADEVKERADREKELQRAIKDAQEAAQQMALKQLTGADEFTAIETEIQRLQGTAAGLQTTLEKLGMTADEAADAIAKGLTEALAKLRDDYVKDMERSINALSDKGFLNDMMDAQALYKERLKDAKALGISSSLAMQEFSLSLASIATESDVAAADLRKYAKELGIPLSFLKDAVSKLKELETERLAQEAAQATEKRVADARSEIDRLKSAFDSAISAFRSFAKDVKDFRESIRLDSSLSTLSATERLAEARRQYQSTLSLANQGDRDAMSRLTDVSRAYLDQAKQYYASSADYAAIFNSVDSALAKAGAKADEQVTAAQKQIDLLARQISSLQTVNESVLTVARLTSKLTDAVTNYFSVGGKKFSSGGYTGDIGINDVAGVVHGREFVANARTTAMYRPQLEAMQAGTFRPTVVAAGNDNSEALREVARSVAAAGNAQVVAIREEMAGLRSEVAALRRETQIAGDKKNRGAGGNR